MTAIRLCLFGAMCHVYVERIHAIQPVQHIQYKKWLCEIAYKIIIYGYEPY